MYEAGWVPSSVADPDPHHFISTGSSKEKGSWNQTDFLDL